MKILARSALRKERLNRKLKLSDPSYYARISKMQLSRIERRERAVTNLMANRLCQYYNKSFFELFEIVEDDKATG